jgi:DNA repair photolyase
MEVEEIKVDQVINTNMLLIGYSSIDPYVGCQFGCPYCYVADASFLLLEKVESKVEWGKWVKIKVNAAEILQDEMKDCEASRKLMLSYYTDPYQPFEKKYQLTRRILDVLSGYRNIVSIITKSPLLVRDVDILKKFEREKISVGFSINSIDRDINNHLNKISFPIEEYSDAISKLKEAKIPTFVNIDPAIPNVTDIEAIVEATGADSYTWHELGFFMKNSKRWEEWTKNIVNYLPGLRIEMDEQETFMKKWEKQAAKYRHISYVNFEDEG